MKIELSNASAAQSVLDRPSAKVASANVSSASISQDRTTFSSKSGSVQSLVNQALGSPEIRQDRVQSLKNSIASGEYKLDANKIAGAIISEGGR